VAETQAGKGALHADHPQLAGVWSNRYLCRQSPGRRCGSGHSIGTRLGDFTTASKPPSRIPRLDLSTSTCEFDAFKHAALPLTADALVTSKSLERTVIVAYSAGLSARGRPPADRMDEEVERIFARRTDRPLSQASDRLTERDPGPTDIIVNAAGSLPGDLHKLWRTRDPKATT